MNLKQWLEAQVDPPAQRVSLAAHCGVNLATVYRWEAGASKPGIGSVAAIKDFTRHEVSAPDLRPDWFEAMSGAA